jgi:hypothetical protein
VKRNPSESILFPFARSWIFGRRSGVRNYEVIHVRNCLFAAQNDATGTNQTS